MADGNKGIQDEEDIRLFALDKVLQIYILDVNLLVHRRKEKKSVNQVNKKEVIEEKMARVRI